MKLRVAFDATPIPSSRLGVGIYVTELLRAMADADISLDVFANSRDAADLAGIVPRASVHAARTGARPLRLAWGHSVLPLRVRRLRPHVFHGPHYAVPAGLGATSVVTFHDPTFFTHPQLHERAKVAYFGRAARHGVARAGRTIAVSEYARQGAISHAGADPAKVDVVHEGVDLARYRPAADGQNDGEPYILFVGALEPRKDVPTLIAAYGELAREGLAHRLVLCGLPAWGAGEIEAAVAGLKAGEVRRTGYVPEAEKIELYQGASVFVYPSIAEGFGLPVLEAMACGVPVVTTTGSAPEEVAGEAALLVPPRDPPALRDSIARVLSDDGLAAALRTRGLARAREFTWDRAAAGTVAVWRRAWEESR